MLEGKNFKKYAPHNVLTIGNNPVTFEYSICLKLYGKESVFQVTKDENAFRENGLIGMNLLYDQNFKIDLEKGILNLGPKILHPQPSADKKDKICFINFEGGYSAVTKYDYQGNPILPPNTAKIESMYDAYEDLWIDSIKKLTDEKMYQFSNNERIKELLSKTRLDHIKEGKEDLLRIITEFHDIFPLGNDPLPLTKLTEHTIRTTDDQPVNTKQYRYPPMLQEEVYQQIKEMLKKNILRESMSPFNSPLWIVPKKKDASGKLKWRIVIDYRKLNEKTILDKYPLPCIDEIIQQLGNSKFFSCFDLASGFHQIGMNPKDKEKTAFSTNEGHYEYNRMPFGLKNAPPTFQRMINNGLKGLIGNGCFAYIDDIIVYGRTLEEHNKNLKNLFIRLRQVGLKLQPDKCEYLRPELEYLGHVITKEGIKPNPDRIDKVKNYPRPKTQKQIKQFLGLIGYYRKFIKNFSKIANPLTKLLRKETTFEWTQKEENAFSELRDKLITAPILQFPNWNQVFVLTTDASNEGLGAILSQGHIGEDKPIAFASRTLNKAEINYTTTEKELLAIVWAVKHFRHHLFGRRFKIVTDHKPLVWLFNVKDPTSRLMRWRLKLEEYDYEIIYKKGIANTNADALSRIPRVQMTTDGTYDTLQQQNARTTGVNEENENMEVDTQTEDDNSIIDDENKYENMEIDSQTEESDQSIIKDEFKVIKTIKLITGTKEKRQGYANYSLLEPISNLRDILKPIRDTNYIWKILVYGRKTIPKERAIYKVVRDFNEETEVQWIRDIPQIDNDDANKIRLKRNKIEQTGQLIIKREFGPTRIKEIWITNEETEENDKIKISPQVTDDQLSEFLEKETKEERLRIIYEDIDERKISRILFKIWKGGDKEIYLIKKHIETNRRKIIAEAHEGILGGHYSKDITVQKIRNMTNWPNITKDVEDFIKTCDLCQRFKQNERKQEYYEESDIPEGPNDKISIDIVGPLNETTSGNKYILVIQDFLTRYVHLESLKDKSATLVIDAMWKGYLKTNGKPLEILTDNGKEFINNEFSDLMTELKIKHVKTSVYHPQSNGKNERSHKKINEYLSIYAQKDEWDKELPKAMLTYNMTINRITGFSPFELQNGRKAREAFETLNKITNLVKKNELKQLEHENKLHVARRKINESQRKQILTDKKTISVGEQILIRNHMRKKGDPLWLGPFIVLHKIGNTYTIENNRKVHREDIKKYFVLDSEEDDLDDDNNGDLDEDFDNEPRAGCSRN
ncbi:uncharacterized protein LOC127289595 [Leptopilina boulardi]|uniref:uncharacterized protein LOC127289595 n=1 Tax=Leptopilina boulardi TaxID=63433 RepID=UPI0021F5F49B|nr:uncharacterized protein LOC127289595 [Leptopilina boulardi]